MPAWAIALIPPAVLLLLIAAIVLAIAVGRDPDE